MSTELTQQIESTSSEDTFAIGEHFGQRCRGGEFFLLISDLGGGKTTFAKGIAKGLGSADVVSSPTFTISNIYDCRDGIQVHHFDFYRLSEGGMVAHELAEALQDPRAVIIVEWGDVVNEVLPEKRITVQLDRMSSGEDSRQITVTLPAELLYVTEGTA